MSAILGAPEVDARKPCAWFGWLSEYPEEGYMPIVAVDAEDAERQTRALLAGDEPETEITVVRVKADDVAMLQETCERMAQMERINAELLAALADYLAWMTADFDDVAEMFYRDARMMAPGKSISPEMNDGIGDSERRDTWDRWLRARKAALADTARAALAKAKGEG